MRCQVCSKKTLLLSCKMCQANLCSRHILLELHSCPQMSKKILQEKQVLETKLGKALYEKKSLLGQH